MIDPVLGRVLFYCDPPFSNPLQYRMRPFGLTDVVLAVLVLRPPLPGTLRRAFLCPALAFPLAHAARFTLVQGPVAVDAGCRFA